MFGILQWRTLCTFSNLGCRICGQERDGVACHSERFADLPVFVDASSNLHHHLPRQLQHQADKNFCICVARLRSHTIVIRHLVEHLASLNLLTSGGSSIMRAPVSQIYHTPSLDLFCTTKPIPPCDQGQGNYAMAQPTPPPNFASFAAIRTLLHKAKKSSITQFRTTGRAKALPFSVPFRRRRTTVPVSGMLCNSKNCSESNILEEQCQTADLGCRYKVE